MLFLLTTLFYHVSFLCLLIVDLHFLILAVIAQFFNLNAELPISVGTTTNEANTTT